MKRKKGFTLIEIIIALAVLGAIGMLAYTLFGQGFNLYNAEVDSADRQENMRLVLSDITNKARITDEADISIAAGDLTVDDYVYSFDGSRIVRNSSELATSIAAFDVDITDGLLTIRIVNEEGDEINTSLYLSQ